MLFKRVKLIKNYKSCYAIIQTKRIKFVNTNKANFKTNKTNLDIQNEIFRKNTEEPLRQILSDILADARTKLPLRFS
jgi:hypothetical protein